MDSHAMARARSWSTSLCVYLRPATAYAGGKRDATAVSLISGGAGCDKCGRLWSAPFVVLKVQMPKISVVVKLCCVWVGKLAAKDKHLGFPDCRRVAGARARLQAGRPDLHPPVVPKRVAVQLTEESDLPSIVALTAKEHHLQAIFLANSDRGEVDTRRWRLARLDCRFACSFSTGCEHLR